MVTHSAPERLSSRWADAPQRLATISLGVPVLLVLFSRPVSCRVFFVGTHAVASYEWMQLAPVVLQSGGETPSTGNPQNGDARRLRWMWIVLNLLVAQCPARWFPFGLLVCMGALYLEDTLAFLKRPQPQQLCTTLPHAFHGLLLVTIPFFVWNDMASHHHYSHTVTLLLIVWNCDTGALVVGRAGKALLSSHVQPNEPAWLQSLSPAKSVLGICGGLVFGTATCAGIPWMWSVVMVGRNDDDMGWWWWQEEKSIWTTGVSRCAFGMLLSILAIVGDLLESAVKRRAIKKDTGKVLPGHGGVLDRFDSSLLAVVAYHAVCLYAK